MQGVLLGSLGLLVIANAWVSWRVTRTSVFDRRQKRMQVALVWLVPLLGLLFMWLVLRSTEGEAADARLTTDLANRVEFPVGGPPEHFNAHADAADIGGFGGGHGGT